MIQWMLTIWSLVPLPFLNPAWTSGSSWFTYCWSLAWRILSITLLACRMSAIVWWFEHSLALPFFWTGMKTDFFQSFPNLLAYWVQHFHSMSFRIWNSSTRIPSPPLALFAVMPSKDHLISHSRISGSRWVILVFKVYFQICFFKMNYFVNCKTILSGIFLDDWVIKCLCEKRQGISTS